MTIDFFWTIQSTLNLLKTHKHTQKILAGAGNQTQDLSYNSLNRNLWTTETTERNEWTHTI